MSLVSTFGLLPSYREAESDPHDIHPHVIHPRDVHPHDVHPRNVHPRDVYPSLIIVESILYL